MRAVLAGQRAPAGKYLPVADGDGLRARSAEVDLPPELLESDVAAIAPPNDWEPCLRRWIATQLAAGARAVLDVATPTFERAAIETALQHTGGRKRDAAELLGWGAIR